jgi:hypothetical protein
VSDPEVIEAPAEVVTEPEWTPATLEAVRAHYAALRLEYLARVSALEAFLGFAQGETELAARVAKLEAFLGIKA